MKIERITGCLLGLATGDALGAPVEFMSSAQIHIKHGVVREMIGGGWLDLRPGSTTDDTAMALALAHSLLEKGAYDREDAAARYVAWLRTGPRDVGNTVRASLALIAAGRGLDEASAEVHSQEGGKTAGNGALMRCAPLALALHADPDALVHHARADAALTHHDPLAGLGAAALCLMIVEALGPGKDRSAVPAAARRALESRGAGGVVPDPASKGPSGLRPTGFVLDTLECAIWAFLTGKTFEDCLVRAVNLGGDADTIGAVCGALAGAWFGTPKIPQRWLAVLDRRQELETVAQGIFERFGSTKAPGA